MAATPAEARRARFRFFHEHAGYSTPPGRAACALELAKAEELLEEAEGLELARYELVDDPLPWDPGDTGTTDADFAAGTITGPYWARLEVGSYNDAGEWECDDATSLGGITCGPAGESDPYTRVVRAELALELRQELGKAVEHHRGMAEELEQLARIRAEVARARSELVDNDNPAPALELIRRLKAEVLS